MKMYFKLETFEGAEYQLSSADGHNLHSGRLKLDKKGRVDGTLDVGLARTLDAAVVTGIMVGRLTEADLEAGLIRMGYKRAPRE